MQAPVQAPLAQGRMSVNAAPPQQQPQAYRPPVAPVPSHLHSTSSPGVAPTITQSERKPEPVEPGCPPTAPDDRTYIASSKDAVAPTQPVRGVLVEWSNPVEPAGIYLLRQGPNPIGRSPDCVVRLDDHQVSKLHATMVLRGDEATFVDVSTNGSLVDGQKVQYGDAPMRHGSVLVIGSRRYVLLLVPQQSLPSGK